MGRSIRRRRLLAKVKILNMHGPTKVYNRRIRCPAFHDRRMRTVDDITLSALDRPGRRHLWNGNRSWFVNKREFWTEFYEKEAESCSFLYFLQRGLLARE